LAFQDEAAALVEVDEVGCRRPVDTVDSHLTFEDVGVSAFDLDGRVGFGNVEKGAQFGQEHLVVRAFAATGGAPSR
jgi:hypothetical protein